MNYELAKELKDAGFPFEWCDINHTHTDICSPSDTPSLSELIVACGDRFYSLNLCSTGKEGGNPAPMEWVAHTMPMSAGGHGETPEEAVARLWLALNKK